MIKQIHARIPDPAFTELEWRANQLSNSCGKKVDSSKLMRLAIYRLLEDLKSKRDSFDNSFYKNANTYIRLQDAVHAIMPVVSNYSPEDQEQRFKEAEETIKKVESIVDELDEE